MRKTVVLLLLIPLLAAGCSRAASVPAPTEPPIASAADSSEPASEQTALFTEDMPDETAALTETTLPVTTTPPATTAPPVTTTVPPITTTASAPENDAYAFTVESFHKYTNQDTKQFPKSHVLLSAQDVTNYFVDHDEEYRFSEERAWNPDIPRDYDVLAAKYDDDFFRTHQLILLELAESSGSIRNTVTSVRRTAPDVVTVEIMRHAPQVMTCDMAYSHVFIELQTQDLRPTDRVEVHRTDVYTPPSTVPTE